MGKRRAEHKLDQDNANAYDDKLNSRSGTFTKASAQEIAARKIATARRTTDKTGASAASDKPTTSWPTFQFGDAPSSAANGTASEVSEAPAPNSLWAKVAAPTDTYNCGTCATTNKSDAVQCAACEEPNPNASGKAASAAASSSPAPSKAPAASASANPWAKYAPATDEYQCPTCTTKNKRTVPKCIACEEVNPHANEPARISASGAPETAKAAKGAAKGASAPKVAAPIPWGSQSSSSAATESKPDATASSGNSSAAPGAWSWGAATAAPTEPEKKADAPASTSWDWSASTSAPTDATGGATAAATKPAPFSWGNASSVASTGFSWSFGTSKDAKGATGSTTEATTLWGGFQATPASATGSFENVSKGGFGDSSTKPDGGASTPMQSKYVFTAQEVEDGESGEDKAMLGSVFLRTHKEIPETKEEGGRSVETGEKKWIWSKAEGELQINTKTDADGKVTARLILRQPVTERVLLNAQVLKVPNQFSVVDNCIRFNEFVVHDDEKPTLVQHMITAQTKAARKPYVDAHLPTLQGALEKL